ncbi:MULTISPECIES: hypothetical protein [unclassified Schlesneria]|uniref:hypothetical protein n=1 Tax=unclassified Schlesneria TaxID=2762017 RepID=UPI002EFE62E2
MDTIRGIFGVGVAQLMMLTVMVPAYAEIEDGESEHRRASGRRHAQVVSHDRADYPVISNWLTSPDTPEQSSEQGQPE